MFPFGGGFFIRSQKSEPKKGVPIIIWDILWEGVLSLGRVQNLGGGAVFGEGVLGSRTAGSLCAFGAEVRGRARRIGTDEGRHD